MSERDAGGQTRAKKAARQQPSFGAFARRPAAPAQPVAAEIEIVAACPDDAVEVGAIVDAYGLKGWVKVVPHATVSQGGAALTHAKRWWLVKARECKAAVVVQAKVHGDSVVAHVSGVGDRDAALALRGYRVYARRADFPALEADEFYWVDLIGLEVLNESGAVLGSVADLIDNGAHSVLRVEYPSPDKDGKQSKGERLIPFVGVYVKSVDLAAKRIVVDWQLDY